MAAPVAKTRSKTAYAVSSAEKDDIIRISAYHRKDFDLAVISFSSHEHDTVATSISSTFRDPTTSIGELDILPLELMTAICLEMDIASLFAFRQINFRARQLVDSVPQYKVAVTQSLDCFCALLRTNLASDVTLANFHHLLCQQICSFCKNNYGDLVHLLNWVRCCSACLRKRADKTRVVTAASVKRVLQLCNRSLNMLPTLKSLPGIYSMNEIPRKARVNIVSLQFALAAYLEHSPGVEPPGGKFGMQACLDFMACCVFPSYDTKTGLTQYGVSCAGCQVVVEQGISTDEWAIDARDMVYSRESFLKHFERCEQAQLLWASSNHGLIEPVALPYGCKRGGYFNLQE